VAVLLIAVSMLAVIIRIVLGNRSTPGAARTRAAQDTSAETTLVSTTVAQRQVALAAAPHDRIPMIVVALTACADGVVGLRLAAGDDLRCRVG
jgi:hypothetical protein